MMKNLLNLTLILFFGLSLNAQDDRNHPVTEKLEAQKVAYISQKLNLTTSESQSFWPLYNEYQADMKALKEKHNLTTRPDVINMSDQEALSLQNTILDMEYEKLEIKKRYSSKMNDVLGPKKVLMLFRMEEQFKKELLERFKNRMNGDSRSPRGDRFGGR